MSTAQRLRLGLLLSVVLIAALAIGAGLVRAAFYTEPAAGSLPLAANREQPVAGTPGQCAGQPVQAPRELRGMWLTTVYNLDFPSKPGLSQAQVKAEYLKWLDVAVAQHHNAIFVHVRPSGDAFWPSAYAPWSNWLTGRFDGKSPGWDPMAFMVAEAHARGLEFHAWFNPYRGTQPAPGGGSGTDAAKLAPNHPLRLHPQWRIAYPTGKNGRFYFDPGIPEARKFVEDSMLEAVQKYDVDGVHFDDFFYPYPEEGQDFPDGASYKKYGLGKSKADWRRENVNTLVREMHERLQQLKPWVKFGISPFGIWRNKSSDSGGSATNGLESYDAIYADTRKWVREGWLDYIVPQLYWTIGFDKADYTKALPWWVQTVKGTKVQLYIGMADYRVGEKGDWSDPGMLDREMALNRKYGVQGEIHFSAAQVRGDRLGAVSRYRKAHYATPALLPRLARLTATAPPTPRLTGARRTENGRLVLTASGVSTANWALYRTTGGPATLVATGHVGAEIADPKPVAKATYCLSTLDRGGNESALSPPA
ncbi:glycosyl hydrolase [Actinoplanes ianthinogenes]|uniref:Glycosyl hydrolase n=1 Tax=Actinoplanes ianthinogenes TaxID=122358 RepID=A0ABM7LLN1_9ACTN|nr:family 10 glycosylhydrolase [Actinoplanes ianthinogenes]BCJ40166.1 glycosyl hydrolase [Actinoplanes ianthinogenes]GGR10702.1 glycosyl hydrolase [Actinoplanes ianthinogenes]